MSRTYYSLITRHGEQVIAKAIANNTPVPLKTMAVGDGNGTPTTPQANQTALVREVYRAEITDLLHDQQDNQQVIAELLIPETVGNFTVREIGIFDEQNKLVAVANCPENYKPVLDQGSGKVQYYRIIMRVSSNDAVTLSINNNIVYATRLELNRLTDNLAAPDGFKYIGQAESVAQLRTIEPTTDQQRILLKSWHAGKNLGGGVFYADFTDTTSADNGGTVIVTAGGKRWKRVFTEITPFDFGAVNDLWTNNEAAFTALEKAFTTQSINLCDSTFLVTEVKSKNRYFNGSFKTKNVGAYSQQQLTAGAGLYYKNMGESHRLFDLVPSLRDGLSPAVNGLRMDFKTGDIWTLQLKQSENGEEAALVKFRIPAGGGLKYQSTFNSKPSNLIGHQGFGICYRDNKRVFYSTTGSIKSTDRAKYISRFEIDENSGELQNSRLIRIDDDTANGNANRCLTITPNGEFLIVTTGRNLVSSAGNYELWGVKVFRIDDLENTRDDEIPTPIYDFPFYRTYAINTGSGLAVQDIACDGECIYILHGDSKLSRNTVQVFTLSGALVFEDSECFLGIEYAKKIGTDGGTTFYEPETVAILHDGREPYLAYGSLVGKAAGEDFLQFTVFSSYPKKTIVATTYNDQPALLFSSKVDMAYPQGEQIRIDEIKEDGTTEIAATLERQAFELHGKENEDSQIRVGNKRRRGCLQASRGGNLGIYDLLLKEWLIYSGLDGTAKLHKTPALNSRSEEVITAGWFTQKLAELLSGSLRSNGWQKLPNGLIIQWGRYDRTAGTEFNYPIAFSEEPFIVHCVDRNVEGWQTHAIATRWSGTTSFSIDGSASLGAFTMFSLGR